MNFGIWYGLKISHRSLIPRIGHRYLIVLADVFSGYTMLQSTRRNLWSDVAEFLLDMCMTFGPPKKLYIERNTVHSVFHLWQAIEQSSQRFLTYDSRSPVIRAMETHTSKLSVWVASRPDSRLDMKHWMSECVTTVLHENLLWGARNTDVW